MLDRDYVDVAGVYYKMKNAHTKYLSHSMVNELVGYGLDVNMPDEDGITCMIEIILSGELELMQHILSMNRADLNFLYEGKQNFRGFTLLHFGVLSKNADILTHLLENRTFLNINHDLNTKNAYGDTPGQLASRLDKHEFIAVCRDYGGEVEIGNITPQDLRKAESNSMKTDKSLASEDIKRLPYVLAQKKEAKKVIQVGDTELIESIKNNDEIMFFALVNKKIDLNYRDDNFMTPLHHALSLGRETMVMALLERKCDINAKDRKEMTPLHVAVIKCSIHLVQALIRMGAQLDACNIDGNTSMHLAAKRQRFEVCQLLLDKGADPMIFNMVHKTPAQYTTDVDIKDLFKNYVITKNTTKRLA
jgi:ankyrin repeat protein